VRRGGHLFAARDAAGWHERRVHLASLRSDSQAAAERRSGAARPVRGLLADVHTA